MKVRSSSRYLGLLGVLALIGWTALSITLTRLDPFGSTALALPFFFGSIFFAVVGTLALVGFYLRVWFGSGAIYSAHISIALRQAILVACALCFALLFQILKILTWWDGTLIVTALLLIEIYFSAQD